MSVNRARRSWHVLLCLLIVAQSLLPLRTAPAASFKAPGVEQDDDITNYRVSISYRTASVFVPYLDRPFIEAPSGPGWRVLLRPNQPFAVFYTERNGSADAIQDPAPGSHHNADSAAGDTVPDFAERIGLA